MVPPLISSNLDGVTCKPSGKGERKMRKHKSEEGSGWKE